LQGDTSSLQGAITVERGAIVRFHQRSSGTYGGGLSGAGGVEKSGSGTLTISGANNWTGSTYIGEGVLSVTTSSMPTGTSTFVDTMGTLRFDQSSNGTYSSDIFGSGTLDKAGSGSLTLDGSYTRWNGTATVSGGDLILASGASLAGAIDVRPGGRLGGSGTAVGDVTVRGALGPGVVDSRDTLDIGGDLDLQAGARLEIDVADANNDSDLVDVSGTATLDPAAIVSIFPAAGNYTSTLTYDILTAGAIMGSIGAQSDFCFFATSLAVVGGNTLQLTLSPDIALDGRCSDTSNQRAVGTALVSDDVITTDPALQAVKDSLNVLTEDEVPQALDEMGGEGLAAFGTARVAAATQFLSTLSNRMRDSGVSAEAGADDEGVPYPLSLGAPLMPSLGAQASLGGPLDASRITAGLGSASWMAAGTRKPTPFTFVSTRGESGLGGWLDGFATFAGIDGDGNSNDTDFNLYGTTGGIDYAFSEGIMLGGAFGYTRSKISVSDLATWGTGDTFQGAVYGTWSNEDFYVGGVARYAYTQMETDRRIAFGGLYEKADADFDGSSVSGYVEAGLAAIELQKLWFQPMASFQYTYLDTEEFTESGAPGLNLNIDSESLNSMVSNLGVRVYRNFTMDDETEIVPELRVRWAHEFGDLDRKVAARFDDVTVGPAAFVVDGAEVGRDVAIVGAGWTVLGEGNTSISLNYDATLNEDLIAHTATLGVLIYW
jgi:outer membrane autotransporter protein